jgi:hypothetical protein
MCETLYQHLLNCVLNVSAHYGRKQFFQPLSQLGDKAGGGGVFAGRLIGYWVWIVFVLKHVDLARN